MHPEQEAFEEAIARDPRDVAARKIYADWLEDNDQPELADLHRAWTPAALVEAFAWMQEFADRHDLDLGDVISAGHVGDWYTQIDGQSAQDEFYDEGVQKEYWRHWQVITGVVATEAHRTDTVFSCSC